MERKTIDIQNNSVRTPWGYADMKTVYTRGCIFYNTPGHGGYHLSEKLNAQVPDYMRNARGWYEEDSDWAIVATVFPNLFSIKERADAFSTLRNWNPDAFEKFYKTTLKPGESYLKDKKLFDAAHVNDWVTVAAFGDWKEGVPKGMVGVVAIRGGKRQPSLDPTIERWFLVDATEYSQAHPHGFVIDEKRHQEIPSLG